MDGSVSVQVDLEQVKAMLQRRLGGRVRDLQVLVDGQRVILRGKSSTYYVKQLAQHWVMAMTKLPVAANEIEVVPVTSE